MMMMLLSHLVHVACDFDIIQGLWSGCTEHLVHSPLHQQQSAHVSHTHALSSRDKSIKTAHHHRLPLYHTKITLTHRASNMHIMSAHTHALITDLIVCHGACAGG